MLSQLNSSSPHSQLNFKQPRSNANNVTRNQQTCSHRVAVKSVQKLFHLSAPVKHKTVRAVYIDGHNSIVKNLLIPTVGICNKAAYIPAREIINHLMQLLHSTLRLLQVMTLLHSTQKMLLIGKIILEILITVVIQKLEWRLDQMCMGF